MERLFSKGHKKRIALNNTATTPHGMYNRIPSNLLSIAKILYNIEIYKGLSNKIKIKYKV